MIFTMHLSSISLKKMINARASAIKLFLLNQNDKEQVKVIESAIRNPISKPEPDIRELVNTVTLSRSPTTEQAEFS